MVLKISETIFIDTAFFKALVDENDDFHQEAIEIFTKLAHQKDPLVTTNFILDETVTLIRVRCGLERVKKFQERLAKFTELQLIRVSVQDEANAWDWFWNDWSKLSFTDCVSFAVMKRLGIEKVATFDEHFKKAGFEIIH